MTGVLADLSAATISAIAIIAVINVFLITLILSAGRARRADKEAERAGIVDSIPEETAEGYFANWRETQQENLASVRDSFSPVPVRTATVCPANA